MIRHGIFLLCLLFACKSPSNESEEAMEYNRLQHSSSPYLRQHAENPVDWYPWGEEALERAKAEGKPILVSIGYSSCHWCHVMERESFENDSIADLMNRYFINIKVDREERPDIDQIYMDAVQAMGLNGGWPLNVFLTSDQKPFYGGTYFPPQNWANLLTSIHAAYTDRRDEIEASAEELTDALGTSELLRFKLKPSEAEFTMDQQEAMYRKVAQTFDSTAGGFDRSPKFPMPSVWHWMLRYGESSNTRAATEQVHRTLRAMAMGGIFDQIGGGFARYSTDREWLAPHFEKMLYDNGQLLRLYSLAYRQSPRPEYRDVVYQTVAWLKREMSNEAGGFYAALDADSEGEEGKYYVWDLREFTGVLGSDAPLMGAYLDVSAEGNWEGHSILRKTVPDKAFYESKGLSAEAFNQVKNTAYDKLMEARSKRVRPGLDHKILTGWNALAITGLLEAYAAFGDPEFLSLARKAMAYTARHMEKDDRLLRVPPGSTEEIPAYLEDYAFHIEACLAMYQATFEEEWLAKAEKFTEYCLANFLDPAEDMFFFTDANYHRLVVRKKELFDNVIPSSNSQMAYNLFLLGKLLDRQSYLELSETMLSRITPMLADVASDMSNWARLHLAQTTPVAEIVIVGPDADKFRRNLSSEFLNNSILLGTAASSGLPLLENKSMLNDRTTVYVCFNKTCKLPVNTVEEALAQLR